VCVYESGRDSLRSFAQAAAKSKPTFRRLSDAPFYV
jgi:hypothetical protein